MTQRTLDDKSVSRIAEAVLRVKNTPRGSRRGYGPPAPANSHALRCQNYSGMTIPANSVAMISLLETVDGIVQYRVARPTGANITNIVIVPYETPAGETAVCFHPSDADRRAIVTFNGSPTAGDEVGTQNNSWELHTGQTGFEVMGREGSLGYVRPFSETQHLVASNFTYSGLGNGWALRTTGEYPSAWNVFTPSALDLAGAGVSLLGFEGTCVFEVDPDATSVAGEVSLHMELRDAGDSTTRRGGANYFGIPALTGSQQFYWIPSVPYSDQFSQYWDIAPLAGRTYDAMRSVLKVHSGTMKCRWFIDSGNSAAFVDSPYNYI